MWFCVSSSPSTIISEPQHVRGRPTASQTHHPQTASADRHVHSDVQALVQPMDKWFIYSDDYLYPHSSLMFFSDASVDPRVLFCLIECNVWADTSEVLLNHHWCTLQHPDSLWTGSRAHKHTRSSSCPDSRSSFACFYMDFNQSLPVLPSVLDAILVLISFALYDTHRFFFDIRWFVYK